MVVGSERSPLLDPQTTGATKGDNRTLHLGTYALRISVAALVLVFAVVAVTVGVARHISVNVDTGEQTTAVSSAHTSANALRGVWERARTLTTRVEGRSGELHNGSGASLGWIFPREFFYSSKHAIAYCSIPKAASSTLTTYLTGITHEASNFAQAEQFIINHGGGSHFDFVEHARFTQLKATGRPFKFFTVVRHPGTRLYSSWFDKIHAHRGEDQPDMLYELCGGNPACTFEAFVDGVVRFLGSGRPVNEHIDFQARLCGTSQYDFDRVFKIENGFDSVARQLETWSGVRFDFTSPSGEEGYSHHTKEATGVYHDFPVEDMDAYERLMPYGLQMKIYRAYKRDFNMFGYPAPVWRDTQLVSCPKLPFVQGMKNTQWKKEDLKVVRRRNLV